MSRLKNILIAVLLVALLASCSVERTPMLHVEKTFFINLVRWGYEDKCNGYTAKETEKRAGELFDQIYNKVEGK